MLRVKIHFSENHTVELHLVPLTASDEFPTSLFGNVSILLTFFAIIGEKRRSLS